MSVKPVLHIKHPPITEIGTWKICGWTGKKKKENTGDLKIEFEWESCPVDFKKTVCHILNFRKILCGVALTFPMSKGLVLYVDFKKNPCHTIEFKGREPQST